ncbi:pancreatic lipase-related protein 2 isoform X1 [Nilaparvata lugens]|uniref:pancreatic lipase-related protein 2 isoform X1 n=1 Tax=Nilaparvata lugens TaxID=108931 RepID=UPI00193DE0F7|nr:pancreatic lipase-related protein 2 isoform X1 [Nilaparvata lugens]
MCVTGIGILSIHLFTMTGGVDNNYFNSFGLYPTIVVIFTCNVVFGRELTLGACRLVFNDTPCPDSRISFFLFTRANSNEGQPVVLDSQGENISQSHYNSSRPSKILIHGYNGHKYLDLLMNIKTEYLLEGDYNIWTVDWQSLSRRPCYPLAALNTQHAGKCLANFIRHLLTQQDSSSSASSSADQIHLIGFSLGAHVAAYTANHLRPMKVARITGLDPAMPLFVTDNRELRLDASDATFVDVIHTNAFVQGKAARCGHIDFYLNGGINQPGCQHNTHNPMSCDHHRSLMYFAESIRSSFGFWGWPCSNMASFLQFQCPPRGAPCLMGANTPTTSRGFCLVYTAESSPYALGRWNTNNTRWKNRTLPETWNRKHIGTNLIV